MRAYESIAIAALVALGGCTVVDVGPLGAEGHDNEIAAQLKNVGRTFRVRGVIQSIGLQDVERLEVNGSPFNTTADRVVLRQPYLRLRDAAGHSSDLLLCSFEPRDSAGLGAVTSGMAVTVTGEFQRYQRENDQFLIVMKHCALN